MTTLLFQTDSYKREFDGKVVGHADDGVVLDCTAFYPGGGGQPSDTGELLIEGSRCTVPRVKSLEGSVVHFVDGSRPPIGCVVGGILDWDRRYALMRTHTAMHILCGVVWRDYGKQVTGGQMEPGRGRLDFEFERMDAELVGEIEKKINAEVDAERELQVRILPRDEAFAIPDLIRTKVNLVPKGIPNIRVVEIVGLDLQADGGTHVANTREVGQLRILSHKSKGRQNKRIVIGLEDS